MTSPAFCRQGRQGLRRRPAQPSPTPGVTNTAAKPLAAAHAAVHTNLRAAAVHTDPRAADALFTTTRGDPGTSNRCCPAGSGEIRTPRHGSPPTRRPPTTSACHGSAPTSCCAAVVGTTLPTPGSAAAIGRHHTCWLRPSAPPPWIGCPHAFLLLTGGECPSLPSPTGSLQDALAAGSSA